MLELGVTFNKEKFCSYDTWLIYNCEYHWMHRELLNMDGYLGNLTKEYIWYNSGWDLSHVIHSYKIGEEEIIIGKNGTVDDRFWQTRSTIRGKCYTFSTPSESNSKVISFTTQSPKFTEYKQSHDLMNSDSSLYDIVQQGYKGQFFPASSISVTFHPRQDKSLYYFTTRSFSIPPHEYRIQKFHFKLKKVMRIEDRKACNFNPLYSKMNCIENCSLIYVSEKLECRPPFINMSHLSACNSTMLELFKKYLMSSVDRGIQKCHKSCLLQCISDDFEFQMVKFNRKMVDYKIPSATWDLVLQADLPYYELFTEKYLSSLETVVSEIGGMASTFLGLSLYSVLIYCSRHFTNFISSFNSIQVVDR